MSDLVTRLRERNDDNLYEFSIRREAADEIERLTADLEGMTRHVRIKSRRIAELESQIESLQNKCAARGLSPADSDALMARNKELEAAIRDTFSQGFWVGYDAPAALPKAYVDEAFDRRKEKPFAALKGDDDG